MFDYFNLKGDNYLIRMKFDYRLQIKLTLKLPLFKVCCLFLILYQYQEMDSVKQKWARDLPSFLFI